MCIRDRHGSGEVFPAKPVAGVADTTGAGDTVAGVFTLSRLSQATPREAAQLANLAGAAVVTKLGAATTSVEELLSLIHKQMPDTQ